MKGPIILKVGLGYVIRIILSSFIVLFLVHVIVNMHETRNTFCGTRVSVPLLQK